MSEEDLKKLEEYQSKDRLSRYADVGDILGDKSFCRVVNLMDFINPKFDELV